MEEKKEVIEKRIKPGVIRRRAKKPPPEPAPEPEVAETAEAAEAAPKKAKAPKTTRAKKAPEKKAAVAKKKEPKKAIAEKEKEEEVVEAPAEEKVEEAKEAAVEEKVEKKEEKEPPRKEKKIEGPVPLPEGPPVGTIIQLPHMKKPKETTPPSSEPASLRKGEVPVGIPPEEEADQRLKRPYKKPKTQKEELDIEGFGKVSTLSQIARLSTRTVAERVFQPSRTGKRRRTRPRREGKKTALTMPKESKRIIKMEESIIVSDLAQQLGVRGGEIVKKLVDMGSMVTLNQSIDFDTASIIAHEYQWEVKRTGFEEEEVLKTVEDKPEDLVSRAPVVTVMGHVDHGKTSLLDVIRATQVAEGEAGGITQHIGSYRISLGDGKDITFIDTPGHEAFTAMRARGAAVTDIVILVVAADDGVMPQTIEAINHAKAADVPIIVAVNKIDKPGANPDTVKRQLSEHGMLAEDWGGETLFANVSAKTKEGIDNLLELVFLQAELLDLKANPNKEAKGVIIEAELDKGRGPVATALIQEGALKVGDCVVAGNHFGRIRAILNDRGEELSQAGPSDPVEILGLDGVPSASDTFQTLTDEKMARQVVEHRQIKAREERMATGSKMSLEDLFGKMQAGEVKNLGLVIKADVQGAIEALQTAFEKLPTDKVKVQILHSGVGGISEWDVMLAQASEGIIIGFNVRPDTKALEIAEREGVEINVYRVIYEVIDDVRKAMEGLLEPTFKEKYLGRAEVRQVFTVSKVGNVAGCKVVDGKIVNNQSVRLLRDNVIVHEGKLSSLKRFKDDAKEVLQGFECGMGFEGYNDIKEGDVIECYMIEKVKTKLE